MGVPLPALLADLASSLQNFVRVFVWIYILLIFAYVLSVLDPAPVLTNGVNCATVPGRSLSTVPSPVPGLPTLGPLDVSPIIAVVVLLLASEIVIFLIGAVL